MIFTFGKTKLGTIEKSISAHGEVCNAGSGINDYGVAEMQTSHKDQNSKTVCALTLAIVQCGCCNQGCTSLWNDSGRRKFCQTRWWPLDQAPDFHETDGKSH